MGNLVLLLVVISLLSANLTSSLGEDDVKDLDLEKDILNTREEETKVLERHPRAVRIDKLLKYFMFVMKKASPKLRYKIMNHIRRPRLKARYRYLRKTRKGSTIVARDEKPGWGWTIIDTLDAFGVFDYLFSLMGDDEPEPKPRARRPPPKKTKKKSPSRQFSAYIRTV